MKQGMGMSAVCHGGCHPASQKCLPGEAMGVIAIRFSQKKTCHDWTSLSALLLRWPFNCCLVIGMQG